MPRVWTRVVAVLALAGAPAGAAEDGSGLNALVDRLSTRVDGSLAGDAAPSIFRDLEPAPAEGERATVTAAVMGPSREGPDEAAVVRLTVRMPGAGPRLLLVDAGLVLRGPGGADYAPVPNQRFVLSQPETVVEIEALPLWPDAPPPPEGTPLRAVWSNDPGLIAVLRTFQRLEAEDAPKVARYVRERDGAFVVDTFLENRDVRVARWMSWSRDAAGELRGRLPRDALRFAIFAVTSGYTIQETADWLRLHRKMDMNPAIGAAWDVAKQTEYVLERAGLNFRVFSPNYAEFHYNQGVAAFRRNDLEAAEKAFREATDLDGSMAVARYNLGVTLYRAGRYQEAAEVFLIASGMEKADANTFFNRGATLFRLGDKLGAARAFRRALELNPRDPDAADWIEKADPEGVTKPKPKRRERRRGRRRR